MIRNIPHIYTAAVGFIIFGLCLRFGGEKYLNEIYIKKYNDSPNHTLKNTIKYGGVAIYVCGWLIIALCLSFKHKGNNILKNSIFSAIIISMIWVVFEFKEENFVLQPKLPLISCSVLLSSLMALISLKYKITNILLIMVASILIIFAEYFILPFERNNNINDGLGVSLLILGWFILFHAFNGEEKSNNKYNINNSNIIPLIRQR